MPTNSFATWSTACNYARASRRTACPQAESGLRILEKAMERYLPGQDRPPDLVSLVQQRMDAVAEIYQRVIFQQQSRQPKLQALDAPFELRGMLEPAAADQSNQEILQRLATDSPALYEIVAHAESSPQGRGNLFRFLWSAFASSERYATVIRAALRGGWSIVAV